MRLGSTLSSVPRFRQFAIAGLLLNLFVIVWGALVRATGSGAGCGSHWPLCNGEVIPVIAQLHTLIEFVHRATSGLSLIFAVTFYVWARKLFQAGHPARKAAGWTLSFTLSEALIGAGLVLFELVAHDKSVTRAVSISLHLLNTLVLVASLTLAVRWASVSAAPMKKAVNRTILFWVAGCAAGFAALGVTGTLTALGDTLFKATSLTQGIAQDFSTESHFLLKLRVLHPFIAVAIAALFFVFAETCQKFSPDSSEVAKWARRTQMAAGLQVLVGAINLGFLAPTALQLVHLLIANLFWISFVNVSAETLYSAPALTLVDTVSEIPASF